jgi:hypothetical protein
MQGSPHKYGYPRGYTANRNMFVDNMYVPETMRYQPAPDPGLDGTRWISAHEKMHNQWTRQHINVFFDQQ